MNQQVFPTIFVVNRSAHDFSSAEKFGNIVFMTEGIIKPFEVAEMYRMFDIHLGKSTEDDYILPCGLNNMNMIACSMFAARHGKLNLLLYRNARYIRRTVVFKETGDG